jgi:3-dehydroquinate dehydratase-2
LNLLGLREPEIYGASTLQSIESRLQERARALQIGFECLQSNAEHELIAAIHAAKQDAVDLILFNPGAFTHTSIALRDALLGVAIPFIEIHLSNIFAREEFRHRSYFSDIAVGCIFGLGPFGYELALEAAASRLRKT